MFELGWYGIASIVILAIWIVSFITAEIWKHAWTWMDDGKPEKYNFIVSKINTIIKSICSY